jgi:CRP/FNR family transcriptional regulator, cyclic AMP receptor protein
MKPSEPVREQIRRMWLFSELTDTELDMVAQIAMRRQHERGKVIMRQNDVEDTDLYCVLKGHLKVTACDARGDELLINLLHPGDLIGEISFLDGGARSATVTVLDRCELLAIRRGDFGRVLSSHPRIGEKLLVAMASVVRRLTDRAGDSAFLDVRGRLAKRLIELSELIGTSLDAQRVVLKVKLSQQELGDMVQATRESVNKCLRELAKNGLIERLGGRIVIVDRERLRALVAAA